MPKVRKAEDGFNLAFLDVIACGLGAVILIFILVDFKRLHLHQLKRKKN
mgnify:CR=1 FL=1